MNWNNLEGKRVIGNYLGYIVCGDVIESRVAYGGHIKHTIKLIDPRNIFGLVRDHVILEDNNITDYWTPRLSASG